MPVEYGRGAKKKATQLHSLVVRTRAGFVCEHCGIERGAIRDNPKKTKVAIQCAHIISRQFIATRTDERNAFALCGSCHYKFGKWPLEFARFVIEKHGSLDLYNELKSKVDCGYVPDWDQEIVRLQELLDETSHRMSSQV